MIYIRGGGGDSRRHLWLYRSIVMVDNLLNTTIQVLQLMALCVLHACSQTRLPGTLKWNKTRLINQVNVISSTCVFSQLWQVQNFCDEEGLLMSIFHFDKRHRTPGVSNDSASPSVSLDKVLSLMHVNPAPSCTATLFHWSAWGNGETGDLVIKSKSYHDVSFLFY